jgi:hypothetical protein
MQFSIPLAGVVVTSAAGLLGGHAHFLHWGVVQISLANLIVIVLMLVVFALAVIVPFPHSSDDADAAGATDLSKARPDVPS